MNESMNSGAITSRPVAAERRQFENVAFCATSDDGSESVDRAANQRFALDALRHRARALASRNVRRKCRMSRPLRVTAGKPPPMVSAPRRSLWERPPFFWRRRRSNRPRKLSGKRTAGGWVSGKWRAPHLAHAHRRSKPALFEMGVPGESFRSPDRGGRERRSPCVVLTRL